jgi:hypothetical protein
MLATLLCNHLTRLIPADDVQSTAVRFKVVAVHASGYYNRVGGICN